MTRLRHFAHDNGLSLAVFAIFFAFLCAESATGVRAYSNDRGDHGLPPVTYAQFLTSGHSSLFETSEGSSA